MTPLDIARFLHKRPQTVFDVYAEPDGRLTVVDPGRVQLQRPDRISDFVGQYRACKLPTGGRRWSVEDLAEMIEDDVEAREVSRLRGDYRTRNGHDAHFYPNQVAAQHALAHRY